MTVLTLCIIVFLVLGTDIDEVRRYPDGGDPLMSPDAPAPWRRLFNTVERVVGPPLERGATSSEFATGASLVGQLRRSVGRGADAAGSWALHQLAMPSHADVRALQRQLAKVERELGALRRELDTQPDEGDRS